MSADTLGEVPLADLVSPNGVRSSAIRTGAVTPTKLSGFPAASTLRLSREVTHSAQGATLHPDFEVYDTDPTAAPAVTHQNLSGSEHLQAGQSVHIEVLQGSGSDLNVRVNRFNMT